MITLTIKCKTVEDAHRILKALARKHPKRRASASKKEDADGGA